MNLGVFVTALGGASVEFFETAAIAYAIARSGYPREAIWGTLSGLIAVGSASAILGVGLQVIPLHTLQLFIGIVLLWFGWGWYKKSILRQAKQQRAGWIFAPLEAEEIQLEQQPQRFSILNFVVMFKSSALETLEVVLVTLPLGLASRAWTEALSGMGLALLLTVVVVMALHGYLVKVPDVWLKLSAGVLLLAYGTFWLGEGAGLNWFIGDWMLLVLIGIYVLVGILVIRWLQTQQVRQSQA